MPYTVDFRSDYRQEDNGSHTVTITISSIPTRYKAQQLSNWVHGLIRDHASEIGLLGSPPVAQPPGVQ